MTSMNDREIGELWHELNRHSRDCVLYKPCLDLIHKLVEERARYYEKLSNLGYYEETALRDFGILPEDWK